MSSIVINAPPDKVFEAMCDLTRHANWAKHVIVIEAQQEGPPAVGNTYTSQEKTNTPDRLTITEMSPNETFRFHSRMDRGMGWEFDHTMTATPDGEGTLVTRGTKITKFPIFMLPMKLMIPLMPSGDNILLNNLKKEVESAG